MSSAAVGTHSGAGPLSLMSCVRESSPLQDYEIPENEKNAGTKKKFWNPKKWFKRKNKATEDVAIDTSDKDVLRSRSTSELSISEEQTRRRSGSSMHPGLSVSHDSVFHSPNSGSDIELDAAQSSSSLSISQPLIDLRLQTELSERLRLRRGRGDTSEDDEGLPHSPCNSPTTTDALLDKTAIKDLPTKSHSTCSDGSLLSMGSSEMDEESFSQSRHSSKLSLHEKRVTSDQDFDLELGPCSSTAPLNHSAAHHRVSVRPKRRAPHRSKRGSQLSTALPTTPEVNEESSIRSMTPENSSKEAVTELYSSMSTKTTLTVDSRLKCSSLPPGVPAPALLDGGRLNRSSSNAGARSQDRFAVLEEDVEREEKSDRSFFDRIFPRRSGKKRKSKEEKPPETSSHTKRTEPKPIAAPRSGAAARQRVQPIDLPESPESKSPLHVELESRFKQRQTSPPPSPRPPRIFDSSVSVISKTEFVSRQSRNEEIKSKMKIAGLSSLQQRVLSINDEVDDDGFKSLTDLPDDHVKAVKPVAKSHSFKSGKSAGLELDVNTWAETINERRISMAKASSLDSVEQTEEPVRDVESETVEFGNNVNKNDQEIKEESTTYLSETSDNNESKTKEEITRIKDSLVSDSFNEAKITISGPSHTAVVNVTNSTEAYSSANTTKTETVVSGDTIKEVTSRESVSVTKIQLKRESTQITTQSTVTVPEFLIRQLNKVETRPTSNVVLSMNSPRIIDEQSRPKTSEQDPKNIPRKFSQEDIEIIEKKDEETETEKLSPLITVIPMTIAPPQNRFKKNDNNNKRKSSVTSTTPESPKREKPFLRSRSISLDSLKGEENSDKSSQDSLDKLEEKVETPMREKIVESVVLRRKSLIKQKNEEEPELMKVFARRSLKLKDSESESLSQQVGEMLDAKATRDSDKENQADSPKEERKKSMTKSKEESENREPLEAIKTPMKFVETTEVMLRRPSNNFYSRAFSVNPPRVSEASETNVKKQASFNERRRTDNWMSNIKNGDDLIERKISQDEIITGISPKSEFISTAELITETKNFNQRKAEWEKRAQEAQKKSVP